MGKRKILITFIFVAVFAWIIIVAFDVFYYHRKHLESSLEYDIFDNIIHVVIPIIIVILGVSASRSNEKVRKLSDRNLHINAILRAIRNVNQLIVRGKDRERLARVICDNLIEDRGYRDAWLAFTDETGAVTHTAHAGAAESAKTFTERLSNGGISTCERAALNRPGIQTFSWDCPDCAGCKVMGMNPGDGVMAMRLEHEGRVYGLLRVLTESKWLYDEEEHSLLIEVAGDIAFSLHAIKMDEERLAAQKELLDQKTRMAEYLRIAGVIFIAIDADESVTLCNKKACDVLGFEENEILGRNWFDTFIHDSQRQLVRSSFRQLMNGVIESVEYFENPILTRSGELRTIAWHNTILSDDMGRITGTLSSGTDITEQRQLERERDRIKDALQQSEQEFRLAFEKATDAIFWVDAETGIIINCNDSAEQMLERSREEIINSHHTIIHPEDKREPYIQAFKRRAGEAFTRRAELEVISKSGRRISAHISSTPVTIGDRVIVQGIFRDLTDIKKEQEEKTRFFNLSIDMISIAGFDGFFKLINPAWTRILGWSEDELKSRPWMDFVHPDDHDATSVVESQLSRGQSVFVFENRYRRKDGEWRWISWNSLPVPEEEIIISVARDVSEQKEYREALRKGEERLRALSQKLIISQEEERARVAREIHDNLGRLLTALSLETEWIIQTTKSDATHIRALLKMIDKTTVEMRRICRGLRPIEIERMGLTTSIESLIQEIQDVRPMQFKTTLCRLDSGALPDETAIAVYRVLQEALNNIVKHASADSVSVALRIECDKLVLDVSDNGRGFLADDAPGGGLGLEGMRERAHLCGGSLDFISEPGKGARVTMIVPIVGEGEQT